MAEEDVFGRCPMGCGDKLFLAAGGHITCRAINCPDPTAVDTILEQSETEHIIMLRAGDFTVMHPLRERAYGDLFVCTITERGAEVLRDAPPPQPGRYRLLKDDVSRVGLSWERLPDVPPPTSPSTSASCGRAHFILACKDCGTVIGQCRCPSDGKQRRYGLCPPCERAAAADLKRPDNG
jgi:hypothetical protein